MPRLVRGPEGLYFERKSLFEGPDGQKKARDRRSVRDDIAEVTAAFANADGGILVLGVEDDGMLTGHALPDSAVEDMLVVPERRLTPALGRGERAVVEGVEVLVVRGLVDLGLMRDHGVDTVTLGPLQYTGRTA